MLVCGRSKLLIVASLSRFKPKQYFIEGDNEKMPFSREQRSIVYSRAKGQVDTLPSKISVPNVSYLPEFSTLKILLPIDEHAPSQVGTRRDVYLEGYEWALHSMFPTDVKPESARCIIGGPQCLQPYSASLMNVSAMSYGALSDNAILALNTGAKMGGFYHNTGEVLLCAHCLTSLSAQILRYAFASLRSCVRIYVCMCVFVRAFVFCSCCCYCVCV
jgi:glutamate synthase domain-containing protein 2